jgi:hypothetical protein
MHAGPCQEREVGRKGTMKNQSGLETSTAGARHARRERLSEEAPGC